MEEVIVTATKWEQSLQDVPVSVSVVSGEQIKNQSLQNLDDLSNWVPGLSVREGGEQTGISIRGFGAGLNFGFDQSVGLFIDGICAGRERRQIGGYVTGSLTDNLAGQLAVRWGDDDGYLKNTFSGDHEQQEEDWTGRVTLLWTPTDRTEARTKLEYSEYDRTGRDFQIPDVGGPFSGDTSGLSAAASLTVYGAYDPRFEFDKNRVTSKQTETADVDSTNIAVEVTHDMSLGTFKSITGYSAYESEDQRDVDWSPTNFLFEPISQDFTQYSQEFQLISDVGEKFDYILGLHYFFNTEFLVDRWTDINIEPFLIPFGVEPFSDTIFGGPADNWRYAQLRFLDQEPDNYSVYAQAT